MTVAAAAGHPQYSGNFIPELWSSKVLVKFYTATCFSGIANTDYEGEIKKGGDKVIIRQTPDITYRTYTKGQSLVVERPEADIVELEINKAGYFNFLCEDVDVYQSDIALMNKWSADAGRQVQIGVDSEVLSNVYADADSANAGATAGNDSGDINLGVSGTPLAMTKGTVLEIIVDCATVLDEQNTPPEDRWLVIPPWARGMIMKSDLKDASMTGDTVSPMRNGRIGRIGDFEIFISRQLYSLADGANTCWHCLFGHKSAISFAAQMEKMETLRVESTFGTIMRGLNVYGYKTLKGEQLGDLYVYKA